MFMTARAARIQSIAVCGSLIAIAALTVVVAQQQPSEPPLTFRAGVDVVQVDVSVLDNKRRPVRDLLAGDFTLLEDGKARPVVGFARVDLREPEVAPGSASWLRDVAPDVATNDVTPQGRLVVIMFDWSIRFEDQQLARRIARAAIDQLGPDDLAAVVFTSAFANNGTPQNFTADRARLLAAVDRPFALAVHNALIGPMRDPRNSNDVMLDDPEGYESGDCLCRVCVAEAIGRIADTVRDVPGRRKTLLFIGTYFRSYEGLHGPVSRPPPGPPASITGIVRPSVNTMACAAPLKDARNKMVRSLALANLTIHTLDPVGLETGLNSPLGGSATAIRERQTDLPVLADLAGGRTVMNTEQPESQLPGLFEESHSYYLLAFAPAEPKSPGRLHKIEVKVHRDNVTVKSRSGYYAGEQRVPDLGVTAVSPQVRGALDGVLPRRDMPLSISVAPFAMPGRTEAGVALVLGVRQPIPPGPVPRNWVVKVLAAAFDRNGRAVQSSTQTVAVTQPPDAKGSIPYEVVSHLDLKPGRYEVRVALDGSAGGQASVYTYVDVPDFAREPLSLSGIVLAASPPVPSTAKDTLANLLPVVPTARRGFSRTERAMAFLRVYQEADKRPEAVDLTVRIVDSRDRVASDLVTPLAADKFTDGHAADYRVDLPVERLESGEYLLIVDATAGKRIARRGVRFTVR